MERGTIRHYSPQEERGMIDADDALYIFTKQQWKGHSSPTLHCVVEMNIRGGALISVVEVPPSILRQEKADAASRLIRNLTTHLASAWNLLEATVGKTTLLAQIVYALALLGLPYATLHLLWTQGSMTLLDLLSNPLMDTYKLNQWALYASCTVILAPTLLQHRYRWLALLMPMFLQINAGLQIACKLRELTFSSANLGSVTAMQNLEILRQIIHPDAGFFLLFLTSLILAAQGIRRYSIEP
jgi:hypothetical protein